jgi:hypothetical protein
MVNKRETQTYIISYGNGLAKVSRMERIRKEIIRTKSRNEEGHITGNRRKAIKMVWSRHKNGGQQIARQVAEWDPQGKRKRGRPVITWKDGIRDTVRSRNLKVECVHRELWRGEKYVFVLKKTVFTEILI